MNGTIHEYLPTSDWTQWTSTLWGHKQLLHSRIGRAAGGELDDDAASGELDKDASTAGVVDGAAATAAAARAGGVILNGAPCGMNGRLI